MKRVTKKSIALAAILLLLLGIFAATAFARSSAKQEPPTLVAVAAMQVADFMTLTGDDDPGRPVDVCSHRFESFRAYPRERSLQ